MIRARHSWGLSQPCFSLFIRSGEKKKSGNALAVSKENPSGQLYPDSGRQGRGQFERRGPLEFKAGSRQMIPVSRRQWWGWDGQKKSFKSAQGRYGLEDPKAIRDIPKISFRLKWRRRRAWHWLRRQTDRVFLSELWKSKKTWLSWISTSLAQDPQFRCGSPEINRGRAEEETIYAAENRSPRSKGVQNRDTLEVSLRQSNWARTLLSSMCGDRKTPGWLSAMTILKKVLAKTSS